MKLLSSFFFLLISLSMAYSQGPFPVLKGGIPAELCVSAKADAGVRRAVESLAGDLELVCGKRPAIVNQLNTAVPQIVVGVLGDDVLQITFEENRALKDSAEKHLRIVRGEKPVRLTIAGADKRGAIYGVYKLSGDLGVTAWTWWADVPVEQRQDYEVPVGTTTDGTPKVKYRGLFLNDEWPCLGGWAAEKFGGFNSKFYVHVFELILRLRGNFLWPAMWAAAFYDDDAENGRLANEMGIIMGTSHHEPMCLAQQDWKRRGHGAWNYKTNAAELDKFWRSGIERAKDWEKVVTVGMRGDGDEPMGSATDIAALTNIVKQQRTIIQQVTGKKPELTPQVWALYKEVQDYYDRGMKVPDDVTLLLCDDNWGNVRRLPDPKAKPRKGGYGMYYHFDYVGDPRNYKWLNCNQVERIWDQLTLCYDRGIRQLWVMNVGDLKPMEYPIQFSMDLAWNPTAMKAEDVAAHTRRWCSSCFGAQRGDQVADLLARSTKLLNRRTPEMTNADTYSMENYGEWDRVLSEWRTLELDAARVALLLPEQYRDAYEQIIMYPVSAGANLHEMYYALAQNRRLAALADGEANQWAQRVELCYQRDSLLTYHYNHVMAGGKWNHTMDQTHIGYTTWQQPETNIRPQVAHVKETRQAAAPALFRPVEGVVSIAAVDASRMQGPWTRIENLGRDVAASLTLKDRGQGAATNKVTAEYDFDLPEAVDNARLMVVLSPTLDYDKQPMVFGVSLDGGPELTVDPHKSGVAPKPNAASNTVSKGSPYDEDTWRKWAGEHCICPTAALGKLAAGKHTLTIRAITPGLVFQKVVIDLGGLKTSQLAPVVLPRKM